MYTTQVEPEHGADRGRRHAVLAGAGLGDDASLAHALGEQSLTERVVDLVRTRVGEVFALQQDTTGADLLGEARRLVERGRSTDVGAQQVPEGFVEVGIGQRLAKARIRAPRARA